MLEVRRLTKRYPGVSRPIREDPAAYKGVYLEMTRACKIREIPPLGAGENACSTKTTRLASSLQRKVAQAFPPARADLGSVLPDVSNDA